MILVIIETVAIRAIIVLALLCGLWSGGGGGGYDGILDIVVFVDWGRGVAGFRATVSDSVFGASCRMVRMYRISFRLTRNGYGNETLHCSIDAGFF